MQTWCDDVGGVRQGMKRSVLSQKRTQQLLMQSLERPLTTAADGEFRATAHINSKSTLDHSLTFFLHKIEMGYRKRTYVCSGSNFE